MHRMTRTALTAAAAGAFAFAAAPAAFAQDLNPPPPPEYTCHADGARTVCHKSVLEREDPIPTDIFCGSGADEFEVWDQGLIHQRATRFYNANGDLTKRIQHERWTETQWSNPATGAYVPYTQMDTITDVFAVPGDFSSVTETTVGENVYTDPITHRKVLRVAGRTVFSPEGDLEFRAGPNSFLDFFMDGDIHAFDALCAVLAS